MVICRHFWAAILLLPALQASAVGDVWVQIDYTYDTSGFFSNALARTALETGINNIATRLMDDLTAVTPGPTPFGFDNEFDIRFSHPSMSGVTVPIEDFTVPANTLVVFVGAQDLMGDLAGQGGAGGYSASGTGQFVENAGRRGQGITTGQNAVDFAPWGGAITFDNLLDWSFDTSTDDPGGNQVSFISVVEHEFGHLLGYGGAASWQRRVFDDNGNFVFSGAASIANYGNVVPLDEIGRHWADGVMGTLPGGTQKEAAMNPSLLAGVRLPFTNLDLAGLVDIGWEIHPIPEPSAIILVGMAALMFPLVMRRGG